jgi:hypothetical protein
MCPKVEWSVFKPWLDFWSGNQKCNLISDLEIKCSLPFSFDALKVRQNSADFESILS